MNLLCYGFCFNHFTFGFWLYYAPQIKMDSLGLCVTHQYKIVHDFEVGVKYCMAFKMTEYDEQYVFTPFAVKP